MDYPGEKLLLKMWETLAEKGIGSLLEPWQEKRLAAARLQIRRDEMLKLAQAEKEVEAIKSGETIVTVTPLQKQLPPHLDDPGRVEPTLDLSVLASNIACNDLSESLRKETNVAKAILSAEDILKDDPQEAPAQAPEDDWLYTWRDHAGKVSSSELQDLWGRILAGEVKQPGSYSIRTLDFLRGLSKSEAVLIDKVARFVVIDRIIREKDKFLEAEGISFSDLMFLQEIGIMSGVDASGITTTLSSQKEDSFYRGIVAGKRVIIAEHEDINKKIELPVYLLTKVGIEVLKLASAEVHQDYLYSIAKDLARQGYNVQFADWLQLSPGYGRYSNAKKVT